MFLRPNNRWLISCLYYILRLIYLFIYFIIFFLSNIDDSKIFLWYFWKKSMTIICTKYLKLDLFMLTYFYLVTSKWSSLHNNSTIAALLLRSPISLFFVIMLNVILIIKFQIWLSTYEIHLYAFYYIMKHVTIFHAQRNYNTNFCLLSNK